MAINSLKVWQDPLTRLTTVPASKVLEAAEVIRGLAGSWAASYVFEPGLRTENWNTDNRSPNPQQIKTSRLGQPGFPEINFAPYAYGTNRQGNKGGSLLGHPISFDVVGPTLKTLGADVYWEVLDNVLVPDGDLLTLQGGTSLDDVYALGALTRYPGGLYVVFSQTATPGVFTGGGGIGDGALAVLSNDAMVPKTEASKFEIFRVVDLGVDSIRLDPTKRLMEYFDFPSTPLATIKAIMLIQPRATRLVAVPEPGAVRGQEKTFALVPPARALNTDELYPYYLWSDALGWTEYWLKDPGGSPLNMGTGREFEYRNAPSLPLVRPKGRSSFYLDNGAAVPNASWMNLLDVDVHATTGDILHVVDLQIAGTPTLASTGLGRGVGPEALLGWFEVMQQGGGRTYVRRMGEVNPETGVTFAGSRQALQASDASATEHFKLICTVHDPIRALWSSDRGLDMDALNSSRLTNIIDPSWVAPSTKMLQSVAGTSPSRADRAVFDTRGTGAAGGNANPGSLMDLGFRVVLFPAMAGVEDDPAGGPPINITIPDWSRPITSNEVILDPSKRNESQYITVDYSSGVVQLSHTPQVGSDVWPTSYGDDNPRGELVLFACCVPYTREEGQLGASLRITGSTANPSDIVPGLAGGSPDQCDVYSSRTYHDLDVIVPQTLAAAVTGSLFDICLTGYVGDQIPQSGLVEILQGSYPDGTPTLVGTVGGVNGRGSVFGYDGLVETTLGGRPVTYLKNCYGGGDLLSSFTVNTSNPAVAVWRREFQTPQLDGSLGVDYQYDTTYGAAKRTKTLRLEYSRPKVNNDGSVSVLMQDPVTASHSELFDDLFRSWLLSGGLVGSATSEDAGFVYFPVSSAVVLKDGVRQSVPASSLAIPTVAGPYYVKYTGAGALAAVTLASETALPLTSPEDVLLALIELVSTGPAVYTITDLRNPLSDIDQRVDLYVGLKGRGGEWDTYRPHFSRLSDAIHFANEMGDPTAGLGVQQTRIFVVGPTLEDEYPILVKTDGLVIESAAKTGGALNLIEICWGSDVAPSAREALLDLNGHSNITIRNVSFRYLWDMVTPVPPVSMDLDGAFVVRASGTLCENIVIDNCRVMGRTDGLITASQATYLKQWQVTRNAGQSMISSGISVISPAHIQKATITDNVFWASSSTDAFAVGATGSGISLIDGMATPYNRDVLIAYNDISRFRVGIHFVGSGAAAADFGNQGQVAILHNKVQLSRNEGISVEGKASTVSFNNLYNVFRDVPAVPATTWSQGLYVEHTGNESLHTTEVQGNSVVMAATWLPGVGVKGAAIHVRSAGGINLSGRFLVRGNDAWSLADPIINYSEAPCVLEGHDSVLEASTGHWIIWGTNVKVRNNTLAMLDVNFDPYRWFTTAPASMFYSATLLANHVVIDNVVLQTNGTYGRVVLCEHTLVQGNHFLVGVDPLDLGADTHGYGCYVSDFCTLVGNNIHHLKNRSSWPDLVNPAYATNMTVADNTIYYMGESGGGVVDGDMSGSHNRWRGNTFLRSPVYLEGDVVLFEGNQFSPGTSGGYISFNGDQLVVANNQLIPDLSIVGLTVTATRSTVTGNAAKDGKNGLDVNPSSLTVSGYTNTVTGNNFSVSYLTGTDFTATGNVMTHEDHVGELVADVAQSTLTGNTANTLTLDGNENTIGNNTVGYVGTPQALSVTGTANTIQGNRVLGNLYVKPGKSGDVIVMGNRVQTASAGYGNLRVAFDGAGNVCNALVVGNWVGEDIQFWDLGVPGPTAPPVTSHFICQGNRAVNIFGTATAATQYPSVLPSDDNIN